MIVKPSSMGGSEEKGRFPVKYLSLFKCHKHGQKLQWFEHGWLIYHGCFELVFESLGKNSNPIATDLG